MFLPKDNCFFKMLSRKTQIFCDTRDKLWNNDAFSDLSMVLAVLSEWL